MGNKESSNYDLVDINKGFDPINSIHTPSIVKETTKDVETDSECLNSKLAKLSNHLKDVRTNIIIIHLRKII